MNRRQPRQQRGSLSVSSVLSVFKGPAIHPLFTHASGITHDVIGVIEVHKDKKPRLLESIYEWCLTMELNGANLRESAEQTERPEMLRFLCFLLFWMVCRLILKLKLFSARSLRTRSSRDRQADKISQDVFCEVSMTIWASGETGRW